MSRTLIIAAELSASPSDSTSFRSLTLFVSAWHKSTILVECGQEEKDFYYKWLKHNYLMDFISEIVTYQENLSGAEYFRINPYPLTTQTYTINRIVPENLPILLRNLQNYL